MQFKSTKKSNTNLKCNAMFLTLIPLSFCFISCLSEGKKTDMVPIILATDSIVNKYSISIKDSFKELELSKIIQSKVKYPKNVFSQYEPAINSPKSVTYSKDGSKFYINSLEGFTTVVFDAKSLKKIKEIRHQFDEKNNYLFKNNESSVFDYQFKQEKKEFNTFLGKPVESCLSHDGKYLWVTYYRRNWDHKAESPSAIAIIDTQTDQIIRVMPSGPLPKMIASSNNNKYIAVTHWGDNTIALIDVSDPDPMNFNYVAHIVIDYRMKLNFDDEVDRDSDCGNCLRGTVFTPDSKKVLVAKMGGNGIAVIDVDSRKMEGTITGAFLNLRHVLINNNILYLSSNKYGKVQKGNLNHIFESSFNENNILEYTNWETVGLGSGVRTIDVTDNGKYIFACVNNDSKIAVIDAAKMELIKEYDVASFPVGIALSPDESQLIVTSQGKISTLNSGNTVTVFDIIYE